MKLLTSNSGYCLLSLNELWRIGAHFLQFQYQVVSCLLKRKDNKKVTACRKFSFWVKMVSRFSCGFFSTEGPTGRVFPKKRTCNPIAAFFTQNLTVNVCLFTEHSDMQEKCLAVKSRQTIRHNRSCGWVE